MEKVLGKNVSPIASYAGLNSNFIYDIVFDPGNTNIVYASGHRFFISVDQGTTWIDKTNKIILTSNLVGPVSLFIPTE